MNIGIFSDLHIDTNNPGCSVPVEDALCEAALAQKVDLLLIGGDISNNSATTLKTLRYIRERLSIPCLFVPGNHDLWNIHNPERTAWDSYRELQAFEGNLANGAYMINEEWAVVGDIGWYDYSFGADRYTKEEFDRMSLGDRTWQDSLFALWDWPTTEVCDYFVQKLDKQLSELRDKKVIVMTHVLPHRYFTVPYAPEVWGYFNAFLGSEQYGKLIESYASSVKLAVCGHVHYRKRQTFGGTLYVCSCLGYTREWSNPGDARTEVAKALSVIELASLEDRSPQNA